MALQHSWTIDLHFSYHFIVAHNVFRKNAGAFFFVYSGALVAHLNEWNALKQ